eukprot:6909190-Lingulodinium_polyedra.AAC.1
MTWLVEHAADVATKYLRGADGRTGYERLYGKVCRDVGFEFGERVLFHKRHGRDYNVVMDARWEEGIWLGKRWGSGINRVSRGREVFEVRGVQRVPRTE